MKTLNTEALKEAKEILRTLKEEHSSSLSFSEAKEYLQHLEEAIDLEKEDFFFEFESMEFRIISEDSIDRIQLEELEADPYILGCFNSSFLSSVTNIDKELIEIIQGAEGYESLGKHLINNEFVYDIQQDYKSLDGYGHHFSGYDHSELETSNYHIFRTN